MPESVNEGCAMMTDTVVSGFGPFPVWIYGTAWKEGETERLTRVAIETGFRAIDTANQRRHYVEAAAGDAVYAAVADGIVKRSDLFIQTKFTAASGQDHRIPYDLQADHPTRVRQSFESSLAHLKTDYIDSYLIHGPTARHGLSDADWLAWREMEAIHAEGKIRHLGICNIDLNQLDALLNGASIMPAYVQNRCFARLEWDRALRKRCEEHGIRYQGFSLLTANLFVLQNPMVRRIAERLNRSPAQVIFRFAIQAGISPLTGTTDPRHMHQDLACSEFTLTEAEMRYIERIGA